MANRILLKKAQRAAREFPAMQRLALQTGARDGTVREKLHPQLLGRRWLVIHGTRAGWFDFRKSPLDEEIIENWDLRTGKQVRMADWFQPAAILSTLQKGSGSAAPRKGPEYVSAAPPLQRIICAHPEVYCRGDEEDPKEYQVLISVDGLDFYVGSGSSEYDYFGYFYRVPYLFLEEILRPEVLQMLRELRQARPAEDFAKAD
ncbi:hypothetical protein [Acidithiobacillus sp. AMEEHan]|uniref:hypothetical protein n=1 Tax=Acidithiobacillus sp. AMEEHan TaxID=2994951 RepID=UPI0027E58E6F|nr:hypothetical protein [Acidithiobacillus sp. AMEEHan]